jgi:hypothetical protein
MIDCQVNLEFHIQGRDTYQLNPMSTATQTKDKVMPHINLVSHAPRDVTRKQVSYKHEGEHGDPQGSHETWDPDENEKTT